MFYTHKRVMDCVLGIFLVLCLAQPSYGQSKDGRTWLARPHGPVGISPRLHVMMAEQSANDTFKVWVFFTDKGITNETAYRQALQAHERTLTARARLRRQRRRSDGPVDFLDLPLYGPYVRRVASEGAVVLGRSRWLNAVSISASAGVIRRMTQWSFVQRITPVSVFRRPIPTGIPDVVSTRRLTPATTDSLDYGPSATQLRQIHVPTLHALGYSGRTVTIAMLDTGYRLAHVAFDSLRVRVIAERDFVNGDNQTEDDLSQDFPGQHNHGTETLSAIGGYVPGELIGPAYGADYILAKTETISFEHQVEEDWWVQAVEWADSLGADVVSSSLGYIDWYQYSDMDGQTAVTTQAAAAAASRGIVVVNAMGNEGQSSWQKMIAPADAEGVVTVGAVDSTGHRASFSSKGPTFDGRIKPDVVAMGVAVRVVNPASTDGYIRINGTSFSTPLTAGLVALLLEAQPDWTPGQILAALQTTASQSTAPDTLIGYGVVNGRNALATVPTVSVTDFSLTNDLDGVLLEWSTSYELNIQGWRVSRILDGNTSILTPIPLPAGDDLFSTSARTYFFLDTTVVSNTAYSYVLEAIGPGNTPIAAPSQLASITFSPSSHSIFQFSLKQNFPNPFNPSTRIEFDLRHASKVRLAIYNVLGQEVHELVNGHLGAGHYQETWDGMDASGIPLPSGFYLYRLNAGTFVAVRKMLLMR